MHMYKTGFFRTGYFTLYFSQQVKVEVCIMDQVKIHRQWISVNLDKISSLYTRVTSYTGKLTNVTAIQ